MPRRTGGIQVRTVDQKSHNEQIVCTGPERRLVKKERRKGPERRANANDFLKSVVLGRRQAGMTFDHVRAAREEGSINRKVRPGSWVVETVPVDYGPSVAQTSRRGKSTRRLGPERRNRGNHKQIAVEWEFPNGGKIFISSGRHKGVGNGRKKGARLF
ncbi:MAG: hypothetical protein PHH08_00490 [Candidatus ainarchaeum sp.]|nr:hypothetical protein [Candidatus ainarchaeum sp.]